VSNLRYQAVKINQGMFGWAIWDYVAQRCLRPGSTESKAKQYAAKLNRQNPQAVSQT
jgi:hypothetical protein